MTSAPPQGAAGRAPFTAVSFVVVVAAVLLFLHLMRPILLPFVLAVIVAYICSPLIDLLTARTHVQRWVFALVVLLALLTLAGLVGFLGVPTLQRQLLQLVANPRQDIASFVRVVVGSRGFNVAGASVNASEIAARAAGGLASLVTNGNRMLALATYGATAIFEMILTWVLIGYLLFDARRLSAGLLWMIPPRHRTVALQFWGRLNPILHRYFVGIALVVVYASAAAYVGLGLFLGLHHALLLAIVTGLLELLPLIGPVASATLAGLVAIRQAASASSILIFIAYAIALRLSIDQFFGPLVLGRAAHVRPVLVIFCFLSGGILLGVSGILLAVPTALAIKVAIGVRNEHAQGLGGQGASA